MQLIATSERTTNNISLKGRLPVTYLLGEWVAFSDNGLSGCVVGWLVCWLAVIFSWLAGCVAFSAGWLAVWHFQLVGWLCGIFSWLAGCVAFSADGLGGWHFQLVGWLAV